MKWVLAQHFCLSLALVLSRSDVNSLLHTAELSDELHTSKRVGTDCTLRKAIPAPREAVPSFVAAYPGSGSSLMRTLVPALTGFRSGRTRYETWIGRLSIKTHYPHKAGRTNIELYLKNIHRVVLVIRNPMNAIPSYCNHIYEQRNGLLTHSTQATNEVWLRWRDQKFDEELKSWMGVIEYWMDNESVTDRYVMSYEDITGDDTGPKTAFQLVDFFQRSPGVPPIDAETTSCIWRKVAKYDDPAVDGGQTHGAKRKNKVERGFTQRQTDMMVRVLQRLIRKYRGKRYLTRVLKRYVIEITLKSKLMNEGEYTHIAQ